MDFRDPTLREKIRREVKNDVNKLFSERRKQRYSARISPSSLGGECVAALWYSWRWATAPAPADGRMARYNSRGEDNEADVIEWLRATGWTVWEKDEATGEQIAVTDLNGHLYGKIDGIASHPVYTNNIKILLEFKYVNTGRFGKLTLKALIQSDIKYYTQVCIYLEKLDLPACMFIPANRNDEDIEFIIIPRDDTQVKFNMEKARTVMFAKQRPARVAESPAFVTCRICDHLDVCHNNKALAVNCRSCVHCVPTMGGKFHCERWNGTIPSKEAILSACGEYQAVK